MITASSPRRKSLPNMVDKSEGGGKGTVVESKRCRATRRLYGNLQTRASLFGLDSLTCKCGAMSQETSTTGDQPTTTAPAGTLYQPTPSTAPRPIAAAGTATTSTPAASTTQPSLNTIQANLSSLLRTPASATHSAQIAAALAPHMTQIMNLAKQGTLTESQMAQVCTIFYHQCIAYASTVIAQNACGNSCTRCTAGHCNFKRCQTSCSKCATPACRNPTSA